MFGPTAYLRWALRFYGRVEFDLATSGMTPAPLSELGDLPPLDDAGAWPQLRERVAAYNGVPLENESLPTLGTTHALWTAYAALLGPGDEVLVEHPTYEPLYRIAEGARRADREVRALTEDGLRARSGAGVAARDLASDARGRGHQPAQPDRRPRHPTTSLAPSRASREKHGAHILVDEVYAPFDADVATRAASWGASARRLAPNVVVASSLTKVYGLGAHRVGWMLAPARR